MRAPLFPEVNVMPTTDAVARPGLREFLVFAPFTNPQTITGPLVPTPSGGPASELAVDVRAEDRG
jgi:hypothetical protein